MEKSSTAPRNSVPRPRPDMSYLWRYNDYRIEGNVAYIALCNRAGAVVAEALIDLWDLERVRQAACWGLSVVKPGTAYVRGMMRGLAAPRGRKKTALLLHRFVVSAEAGAMIDHYNGDTLDCRRDNLRITDASGNNKNQYGHRRVRHLEDVLRGLLLCGHKGRCECKRRALLALGERAA